MLHADVFFFPRVTLLSLISGLLSVRLPVCPFACSSSCMSIQYSHGSSAWMSLSFATLWMHDTNALFLHGVCLWLYFWHWCFVCKCFVSEIIVFTAKQSLILCYMNLIFHCGLMLYFSSFSFHKFDCTRMNSLLSKVWKAFSDMKTNNIRHIIGLKLDQKCILKRRFCSVSYTVSCLSCTVMLTCIVTTACV